MGSVGGSWDWTVLGKGWAPGAGGSGTSSSRPGAPAANTRDNFQRGLSRPHFRVLPTSKHVGKCSPIVLSLTMARRAETLFPRRPWARENRAICARGSSGLEGAAYYWASGDGNYNSQWALWPSASGCCFRAPGLWCPGVCLCGCSCLTWPEVRPRGGSCLLVWPWDVSPGGKGE